MTGSTCMHCRQSAAMEQVSPSCKRVTRAVFPLPTAEGSAKLVKLAWLGVQVPSSCSQPKGREHHGGQIIGVGLPSCCRQLSRQCWGLLSKIDAVLMLGQGTQLKAHGWRAMHCLTLQHGRCLMYLLQTSLGCPTDLQGYRTIAAAMHCTLNGNLATKRGVPTCFQAQRGQWQKPLLYFPSRSHKSSCMVAPRYLMPSAAKVLAHTSCGHITQRQSAR